MTKINISFGTAKEKWKLRKKEKIDVKSRISLLVWKTKKIIQYIHYQDFLSLYESMFHSFKNRCYIKNIKFKGKWWIFEILWFLHFRMDRNIAWGQPSHLGCGRDLCQLILFVFIDLTIEDLFWNIYCFDRPVAK